MLAAHSVHRPASCWARYDTRTTVGLSLRFHTGKDRLTTTAFLSPAPLLARGISHQSLQHASSRAAAFPGVPAKIHSTAHGRPGASDEVHGGCLRNARCSSGADPAMSLLPI